MRNKLPPRHRVAVLSAVVFVVGGGVGAILALVYLATRCYPELSKPGVFDGVWIPVGVVVLILCLIVGLLVGSILWLFLMRFILSRDELKPYFTEPYIPIVTPFLSRLFDTLYRQR